LACQSLAAGVLASAPPIDRGQSAFFHSSTVSIGLAIRGLLGQFFINPVAAVAAPPHPIEN
jgi:hypothetical protein